MRTNLCSRTLCLSSLLVLSGLVACQQEDEAEDRPGKTSGHSSATGAGVVTGGQTGIPGLGNNSSAGMPQPGIPNTSSGGTGAPGGTTSGGGTGSGVDSGMPNNSDTTGTSSAPEPECNDLDPVKLFLSPDDSNSLSSPAQLRQRLLHPSGRNDLYGLPLRGWEFFNYYTFPYPEPQNTLGAHLELRPLGDKPGHYRMQIGVRSKSWNYETRPAMNLTFVLDTSGSMSGPPLQMLKASVRAITSKLRPGDKVSMVTWSDAQQVLLDSHTVSASGDPAIVKISDGLTADGGTDLHAGLSRGYVLAQKNYLANAINRVVLVSDGGANLGITSKELIGQHASDAGKDGIYLAGVGVGTESSYNDYLMDAVTDAGKGASVFIYDNAEAQRTFGDHFLSTFGIAAKDVRVELNLPAGFELAKFSGEEASSDPTEVEPQHLGPNDAMVFYQEIKTCAPEKFDPNATIKVVVRYTDALTHQPGEITLESSFAQLTQAPAPALEKGSALTYFLDAMRQHQSDGSIGQNLQNKALAQIEAQLAVTPADTELAELKTMLLRLKP